MNRNQKQNNQTINQIEKQISSELHRARLAHHYSLEKLFDVTKIQIKYLKAIDRGNFAQLPGDFYVRAFIKKYADSVGLNGAELLKDYNNKLPDPQNPHYINQISENQLLKRVNDQNQLEEQVKIRQYIPIAVITIIVLVILVGGWLISTRRRPSTNAYNHSTVSFSGTPAHQVKHYRKKYYGRLFKISSIKGTKIIYKAPLDKNNDIQLFNPDGSRISISSHYPKLNISLRAHQKKRVFVHLKKRNQLFFKVKGDSKIKITVNHRILKRGSVVKNPTIILKDE